MKNLKELRISKNLTMKKLGIKIGVAESTISLYESGKRQPDHETLIKFADFFNVSTDYLLDYSDEPKSASNLDDDFYFILGKYAFEMTDKKKEIIKKILELPDDKTDLIDKLIDSMK